MTTRDILLKAYKESTDKNIEFANYMIHKEKEKAASIQEDIHKLNVHFGKLLKNSITGPLLFKAKMASKISEDNNRCDESNLVKMHQNEEDSYKIIECFEDMRGRGEDIINDIFYYES